MNINEPLKIVPKNGDVFGTSPSTSTTATVTTSKAIVEQAVFAFDHLVQQHHINNDFNDIQVCHDDHKVK